VHNFRLCIDGRMLEGAGTGVSTYARALHATLPLVAAERFVLSDTLPGSTPIAPLRGRRLLAALLPGVRPARQIRQDGAAQGEGLFFAEDVFRRAQVHFNLYGRLLAVRVPGPPGIMHWTYPVPLRMIDWANIYTVHDVIPLNQPELTAINGPRHRRLLDRIRQAAAGLATVSAAARDDICTALRLDPSFVVDCGQPVDVAAPAAAPPAGLPPGNYLCVCGTVEPRKNIARLVNAYAASGVTLPLVIAGPDGWRADEIAGLLATTPGVVRLPWLARADMLACIGQ
jgi:glycosyltransferase involved in cell wall biosynthesis